MTEINKVNIMQANAQQLNAKPGLIKPNPNQEPSIFNGDNKTTLSPNLPKEFEQFDNKYKEAAQVLANSAKNEIQDLLRMFNLEKTYKCEAFPDPKDYMTGSGRKAKVDYNAWKSQVTEWRENCKQDINQKRFEEQAKVFTNMMEQMGYEKEQALKAYRECNGDLKEAQKKLEQTEDKLEHTEDKLKHTEDKLTQTQKTLSRTRAQIAADKRERQELINQKKAESKENNTNKTNQTPENQIKDMIRKQDKANKANGINPSKRPEDPPKTNIERLGDWLGIGNKENVKNKPKKEKFPEKAPIENKPLDEKTSKGYSVNTEPLNEKKLKEIKIEYK